MDHSHQTLKLSSKQIPHCLRSGLVPSTSLSYRISNVLISFGIHSKDDAICHYVAFSVEPIAVPFHHRHLGLSCLFAPLYAHALIALILLFSLCVQARLGTPTLDELGGEPEDCIGLVPWQRLRNSPRTDDYENITEVNLRVWHGFVCAAAQKMRLQTQVQQLRVQIPRRSARGLGRETREGQEKGQAAPSQAYVALRRLWRGKLFAAMVLLLVWSETFGVWSVFSSGATQETTSFTATEFCRGCGSGTTPCSSYVADGIEVAGRQRGDRCQDRRGFEPGQRQGQHQRGCQQAQGSGLPHSTAPALRPHPCWRRRSRSATSSRCSCRTTSLFTSVYAWPRKPGRRPAKLSKVPSGKRRTSWSF